MEFSKQKFILFLATGAWVGYVPRLPGSAATLVTLPLSLALNRLAAVSLLLAVAILVGSLFGAIWISTQGAEILRQKDPQVIVIDEIVGFLIANFLSAPHVFSWMAAFVLFRFFDVAKIFPMAQLERLPRGTGIVLDDAVAGLYTFAMLRVIGWWGLI